MFYQQKVITTPRGENIGRNIINNLTECGLLKHIEVKTIITQRDPINKANVTTLEYSFVQ